MILRQLKELERQQDIIQQVRTKLIELYLEKSIGEGTFGKVKLGTHQITGEKV